MLLFFLFFLFFLSCIKVQNTSELGLLSLSKWGYGICRNIEKDIDKSAKRIVIESVHRKQTDRCALKNMNMEMLIH